MIPSAIPAQTPRGPQNHQEGPMSSIYDDLPRGTKVYSRKIKGKKQVVGTTTGMFHPCQLEGCRGLRVTVRWPSGHITHPCSHGLNRRKDGCFEID